MHKCSFVSGLPSATERLGGISLERRYLNDGKEGIEMEFIRTILLNLYFIFHFGEIRSLNWMNMGVWGNMGIG